MIGRLKRFLLHPSGPVLALIVAVFLLAYVSGFLDPLVPSSSLGDPSAAGVIDCDIAWSADSRWIAFTRSDYGPSGDTPAGRSDVFVASAEGRELRRLTRTPYDETARGWLSNPMRVVYSTYRGPKEPTNLYAITLNGAEREALGEVRATDQLLALSHDARRALVGTPRLDPKRYALVDLERRTRRPLPGTVLVGAWAEGVWSRDDRMLAYLADDSIIIVRGDRVVRRIKQVVLGGFAWSPDGRRLAYGDGLYDSSLWLLHLADGSRLRLAEGKPDEVVNDSPVWSPDGSTIYYERGSFGDDDGLRAIAADGTGDRKITGDDWGDLVSDLFSSGAGDRWLDTATVSPDGTKIAYLLGEAGAWKNWSLVGVMDADGSRKTPIPGSV
ncbi:MAG TPA: hypothetical protein VFJ60_01935 [Gaiella sp.]|nr:hypothetical protein [Gaiella sp.]